MANENVKKVNGDIPFVGYLGLSEKWTEADVAARIEEYEACGKNLFTLSADLMKELLDHPDRTDTILAIFQTRGAICR